MFVARFKEGAGYRYTISHKSMCNGVDNDEYVEYNLYGHLKTINTVFARTCMEKLRSIEDINNLAIYLFDKIHKEVNTLESIKEGLKDLLNRLKTEEGVI